jgi:hypothetical protein
MKYNIIFALLALAPFVRASDLSRLETMNIAALETYKQLQGSMAYKAKEAVELAANNGNPKKKGVFGMMESLIKSAFTSTPKSMNPQADLDELAMYYQTLNYADIMALEFLTKNCKEDGLLMPSTDPELCSEYIPLLIKSIEGRLGTLTSQYLFTENLVKAPPEWPEHATEMLKALEEYKILGGEYSVEKSLIRTMKEKEEGKADDRVPMRIPVASPVDAMKRPPPPSYSRQRTYYQPDVGHNQGQGQQGYNPSGYTPDQLGYNQNKEGRNQGVQQGFNHLGYNPDQVDYYPNPNLNPNQEGRNQRGQQGYNPAQIGYNQKQEGCNQQQGYNPAQIGYNQNPNQEGRNQQQGYNPAQLGYDPIQQNYNQNREFRNQGVQQGYNQLGCNPGQGQQGFNMHGPGSNYQMNQGGTQDNTNYQRIPPFPQSNMSNPNIQSNPPSPSSTSFMPAPQLPVNFDKMVPVAFIPASSLKLDQLQTQSNVVVSQQDTLAKSEIQPQAQAQTQTSTSTSTSTPTPGQLQDQTLKKQPQPQVQVTYTQSQTQPQSQVIQAQPLLQSQGQLLEPQVISSRIVLRCPNEPIIQNLDEFYRERYVESGTVGNNNLKPKSVIERSSPTGSDPRLEKLYE